MRKPFAQKLFDQLFIEKGRQYKGRFKAVVMVHIDLNNRDDAVYVKLH